MADSRRVEGERVFCYECEHQWDRAHGGLTCPNCQGEFVEIRTVDDPVPDSTDEPQIISNEAQPSNIPLMPPRPSNVPIMPPRPFLGPRPWSDVPDPEEPDITTIEFSSGGHPGAFTFSRTIRSGGNTRNAMGNPNFADPSQTFHGLFSNIMGQPIRHPQSSSGYNSFGFGTNTSGYGGFQATGTIFPRDPQNAQQPGNMQDLFSLIFQSMQPGNLQTRHTPEAPPNPFDVLYQMFNPGNARQGDMVYSQEAFDRIVSQLMEQNGSSAPGPASENAIQSLPTRKVDKSMMGDDGKAECSICMDNVDIGAEVTNLPCDHWFHGECVKSWLKEHDTCPHCRKPITSQEESNQQPRSSRRRSSRRASSIASPFGMDSAVPAHPIRFPDSPSGLRSARQEFYGNRRDQDFERLDSIRHARSHSDRRHSGRSERRESNNNNNNGNTSGGGWTDWIRDHMHL